MIYTRSQTIKFDYYLTLFLANLTPLLSQSITPARPHPQHNARLSAGPTTYYSAC